MLFAGRYKLQVRSSDKALVMTIPADIVREFSLTKDTKLDMLLRDEKLIIHLKPHPPRAREAAA
jgi:hypothetical protein